MATLTIDKIEYSNIDRTTAKLTGKMTCSFQKEFDGAIQEYWESDLSITSPAGASVVTKKGNITTSGSQRTYFFTATISGLTAGSEQTITLKTWYEKWVYEKSSTTYYYFYYKNDNGDWKEYESTRKATAVDAYLSRQAKGYTMDPDEDSSYVESGYDRTYGEYYYLYTWEEDTSDWFYDDDLPVSKSTTVYTRPNAFYFGDGATVVAGTKWDVSKGIQTILPNIYNFNTEATKWKKWKNQTDSVTECSAFSKGNLSETMLTNAYAYLGDISSYKKGDRVSATMFSNLEDLINGVKKER